MSMSAELSTPWEPIQRLTRDLRASARLLGQHEARYLVDLYYQTQENRIRAAHQQRLSADGAEPHALIAWVFGTMETVERDIARALDAYSAAQEVGAWARSIHGIGPVIAAGLLAHIDIEKAPTVGHIWRFAGLDDPANYEWKKGKKRPWNARLKRLCWIIGGSFVKTKASDKSIYGKVYERRKAQEVERNEAGRFADQARRSLEERKIIDKDLRATLESGKLPDGRIDLRARRVAVKLFLAHYHHVAFESHFGEPPPKPYVIEHGGHAHFLGPPNWR